LLSLLQERKLGLEQLGLEQRQLRINRSSEARGRKIRGLSRDPRFPAGNLEKLLHLLGKNAVPAHARAES
jgi:hypothetical protein